jgi:hypothetical protein
MIDAWNRGRGTSRLVTLCREGRRLTGEQAETLWTEGFCPWCGGEVTAEDVRDVTHVGCPGRSQPRPLEPSENGEIE